MSASSRTERRASSLRVATSSSTASKAALASARNAVRCRRRSRSPCARARAVMSRPTTTICGPIADLERHAGDLHRDAVAVAVADRDPASAGSGSPSSRCLRVPASEPRAAPRRRGRRPTAGPATLPSCNRRSTRRPGSRTRVGPRTSSTSIASPTSESARQQRLVAEEPSARAPRARPRAAR